MCAKVIDIENFMEIDSILTESNEISQFCTISYDWEQNSVFN